MKMHLQEEWTCISLLPLLSCSPTVHCIWYTLLQSPVSFEMSLSLNPIDVCSCICMHIQAGDFNNRATIVAGWGGVPGFILCTKRMRTSLKKKPMGEQWEVPDWRCLHMCVSVTVYVNNFKFQIISITKPNVTNKTPKDAELMFFPHILPLILF